MPQIISISKQPTYDLTQFRIESLDLKNGFVFLQTSQVYFFDQVYGTVINRSRVVRSSQNESRTVENVIAAVIDAGFCGYLFWKIKLTKEGIEQAKTESSDTFLTRIQNAQQIWLIPHAGANYYNGTNQTNHTQEITFIP